LLSHLPKRPDCLLIEGCDFEGFPPGGQLAMAQRLMSAFGNRLALVGICTDDTPVGRWIERDIDGTRYWFYGIGRRRRDARRPLVPARLSLAAGLRRHRDGVLSLDVRSAFVQAPEAVFVVAQWGLTSLSYCFPGVSNPLSISRYRWARPLAGWFDHFLFRSLDRAEVIFASVDARAVDELVARSGGRLRRDRVRLLPTSFDGRVFTIRPAAEARQELGVPGSTALLVCSGRISRPKGWDFLLDVLGRLSSTLPDVQLVFVGDGEDRAALEEEAAHRGLSDRVLVTGFLPPAGVARWLQAADVVVVGSRTEGWSVSMLEALASGRALVSTDVSGACDMIRDGENGYVVPKRDPDAFAAAVRAALELPHAPEVSLALSRQYTVHEMARRVSASWEPLS
jgi:glycosyltransferase involved in cell wall biosynthesis